MNRMAWVVLVAAGGVGCATSKGAMSLAEENFPRRAELQQVALRVPKLDTAKHDAVAVDSWTLQGPFPTEVVSTPVKPSTPWELELAASVPALGNALTADQQCIAREVARFMLVHKGNPGNSLQAFIDRRCGTTAVHVRVSSLSGEVPEQVSEAEWLAQWKAGLVQRAKALNTSAEVTQGRLSGYVQLVDDLQNFQFPPEVLTRPDVDVFVNVSVYRGEDWAHSRYVVCFVIADGRAVQTAAR
ncbi:MAG: hypothetical protein Q8K32_17990 [Archangium sp.]|nr:hypothetical protein [Archangium sp.]